MDKNIPISEKNACPAPYAIKVTGVSKTFRIPHEKTNSVLGVVQNAFKKKTFEEFKALDDVSFEIKKGEFFGIIGRNGSGKSTLLKILAGIYQADKGKIHVNGLISPFLELGIGFNPELSGRDNIYLNASVLGLTKKQIDAKFDSIVAFSELERFIDQKLKNYSSGMQVRLAFSVSIHANRDILLMDEVLAVGDSNFQSKCLEEFNKYKDLGKTVIFVSHDIITVQRYCDRAMLLRNGKVIMIGKSEEVGDKYIYQNMSDEEKRMRNIEDGTNSKDYKSQKVAGITKIEFLDKEGNEKNVFQTNDDILVRAYFQQNKEVDELNFGIAIFNQESHCMFGTNTFINKIDTSQMQKNGYFEINFKNIPLRKDAYYVQAGIWGKTVATQYDYLAKSKFFKIFSDDKNIGEVSINNNWN